MLIGQRGALVYCCHEIIDRKKSWMRRLLLQRTSHDSKEQQKPVTHENESATIQRESESATTQRGRGSATAHSMELELAKHITLHANGKPLLKWSSSHSHYSPSSIMFLLVVWSVNGDGSALTSKANSKVNLLNDDTYRWVCATVIVSSFGRIDQGVK